ncbi:MAG: calcium/sodium antiporter [Phycisphaerales bacterium]
MSFMLDLGALVVGLVVLIIGADYLIRGSAQLARVMGLSPFAIGVTVIAFGTSAPELFASIGAAIQDVPDLAIGNVVGSNIANILLILGVGGLIVPIGIHRRVRLVELPIMLGITILAAVMLIDDQISRIEGVMLAAGLIAYVVFIIRAHRVDIEHEGDEVASHPNSIGMDLVMILGGIIGLGLGAKAMVYGASQVALSVGVPAGVVGTTIVAFGTSLPELAATVRAAMSKESDMAVGNIVGSNVFNLLSVLGITAIIHPLTMPHDMAVHVWMMVGVSVGLVGLAIIRPVIGRVIGGGFVIAYIAYIIACFVGF